jgi:hypothetical protein
MTIRDVSEEQAQLKKAVDLLNKLIEKDQIIEAVLFIGLRSKKNGEPGGLLTLTAGETSCALIGQLEMFKIRTYFGDRGQSLDNIDIDPDLDDGPDGPEGKGPNGKK